MKKIIITVLLTLMVLALCASCGAAPPEPMSVKSLTTESADVANNAADAGGAQLNSMPEMKPAAAPPTVSTTVETSSDNTTDEPSTPTTVTEPTTESTSAATTDNAAATSTTSDAQQNTTEVEEVYIVSTTPTLSWNPDNYDKTVDEYGDEWYHDYFWQIDALIKQEEDIGALLGHPGGYADYQFNIRMNYGLFNEEDLVRIEGYYAFALRSVIRINTDEMADRIASQILGEEVSGLGFGSVTELVGEYQSLIPYYIDDNGFPVAPPYDEANNGYVFPAGKENATKYDVYCYRIPDDWESSIVDRNGQIVQPEEGSYLMYESFVMEYKGSTYHIITDSFDEHVVYNVFLYVVIDPGLPSITSFGIDAEGYLGVKVYMNLKTSEHHSVWLEGEGRLFVRDRMFN